MGNTRHLIYISGNPDKRELIYTGLDFHDFITGLKRPIQNLLLLKGEYFEGQWCDKYKFELIVGAENIKKFSEEDVYQFGDFGFVDYADKDAPNRLSSQQVAELLYVSHVYRPLNSPFFDILANRFVYLAHDDGFYCKLLCNDFQDLIDVLFNKLQRNFCQAGCMEQGAGLNEIFLTHIEQGMFVDLNEAQTAKLGFQLPVYLIGKIDDMDVIYNSYDSLKRVAKVECLLSYYNGIWDYNTI